MTGNVSSGRRNELPAALPVGLRIGGRVVAGGDAPIRVVNPATGEVFAEFAGAGEQDVDRAVSVADETFRAGGRCRTGEGYRDFVQALVEVAASIRIGDPSLESTQLGPVISELEGASSATFAPVLTNARGSPRAGMRRGFPAVRAASSSSRPCWPT
jgi:hypothetical protein